MSINKVLNRPMFRREALKKGHLKPIKARTGRSIIGPMRPPVPALIPQSTMGTMIGSSYNNALALRAQPTFLERMGSRARSFGRGLFSIPALGGYYAGDKVAQGLGIQDPIGRGAFGLGGGIAASRALPALASIGMIPSAVGIAGIAGIQNRIQAGIEERRRINAMSPEERADFERQNRLKATDIMSEGVSDKDIFGRFDPKTLDDIVKVDTETKLKRGVKRGQTSSESKVADIATEPQNTTKFGKKNVIDTAKIAENAIGPNPNINFPMQPDTETNLVAEKPEEDKETKTTSSKNNTIADEDTVAATSPFAEQINLARQIAKEMRTGKTSNANLVFLTNLASGLLTGTTKRQGVGGALEVFGQALGPAVNNMVMVKMKEDEIEQNLLGQALEFSTDFLKAQNEAFEMPDTKEVGVIQFTDENGQLTNVAGRMLNDGTKQIETGTDPRTGLAIYQTVSGANTSFIPNKDRNKETLEIAGDLSGKYGALNLINRSLGTIIDGEAKAGVIGAVGLYGGRLTEALGDVFAFTKPTGDNAAQLRQSGKAMFELERNKAANRLVNGGEYATKEEALRYLNNTFGTYDRIRRNYLKDAKRKLKDGTTLDYERLAINETVLVYKLANSLKSKDRLTQKDIEMAKNLVKVFPLLRGEKNVIASLQATAETILDDIRDMENTYLKAGGASSYLKKQRQIYGIDVRPTEGQSQLDIRFKDLNELNEDELEKKFRGL
jgi:hypothetical protein